MKAENIPKEVPGCGGATLMMMAGFAAMLWRWLR